VLNHPPLHDGRYHAALHDAALDNPPFDTSVFIAVPDHSPASGAGKIVLIVPEDTARHMGCVEIVITINLRVPATTLCLGRRSTHERRSAERQGGEAHEGQNLEEEVLHQNLLMQRGKGSPHHPDSSVGGM
jgi:hypothetical protein